MLQSQQAEVLQESDRILRLIPNLTHPDAPHGGEEDATEVRRGISSVPAFSFMPKDHVDLGENLKLFDFEAGSRVAGHGFYFLTNDGVLLELALQKYVVDLLMQEGFTVMTTPDVARDSILEGTGFMPRGPETQIYSITDSDLSLVATAEITLGGACMKKYSILMNFRSNSAGSVIAFVQRLVRMEERLEVSIGFTNSQRWKCLLLQHPIRVMQYINNCSISNARFLMG